MPRLLAVGHVTWDLMDGRDVLGGAVSYAALAARRLGWEAAVLTCAGPEFEPARHLPGVEVFCTRAAATTRFRNLYDEDGERRQVLDSRADPVEMEPLPDVWRDPDVLFLAPVAGEVPGRAALAFGAQVVGAGAQGWLRSVDASGRVSPREWTDPCADLAGVHALFLSRHDVPGAEERVPSLLAYVPIVALTRGWQGAQIFTREGVHEIPALPRPEVDATGAGDVFAAALLLRYHETGDLVEAGVFGACAASCVVEGVGTACLGDREEVKKRMGLHRRLVEDGEWDE
jgi:sugar/nucleoside kinase (ribokinase family)